MTKENENQKVAETSEHFSTGSDLSCTKRELVEEFNEIAGEAVSNANEAMGLTCLQIAWKAYRLMNKAAELQNKASKMAVYYEGAKGL